MKKTFKIEKLVRDNYVNLMAQQNIFVHSHQLSQDMLSKSLKRKLLEEAEEVFEEEDKNLLQEEMGDVLEVLYSLCHFYGFSMDDIEKKRQEKTKQRGSFTKGTYVTSLTIDESNDHIHYFLDKPHIYPEIKDHQE